jgi:hypothetical protein
MREMTDELREKISIKTKEAMADPSIKEKMRLAKLGKPSVRKGKKHSEESKIKMRESSLGQVAWNKGLKGCYRQSKETIAKRTAKMMGSDNPAWKGGVTSENSKIRCSIKLAEWREAVFIRDDWTCQKTGKKGGRLHAHHIQNFADKPKLRASVDNGITLSREAHIEFHSRYGLRNNTTEQIVDFLEDNRKDQTCKKMLIYSCVECGYDVIWFEDLRDIRQVEAQLCLACFLGSSVSH